MSYIAADEGLSKSLGLVPNDGGVRPAAVPAWYAADCNLI
jgi:hypothetical protein